MKDFLEIDNKIKKSISIKSPKFLFILLSALITSIIFIYFVFLAKISIIITILIIILLLITAIFIDKKSTTGNNGFLFEEKYTTESIELAKANNIIDLDNFKKQVFLLKDIIKYEEIENKNEFLNKILNALYFSRENDFNNNIEIYIYNKFKRLIEKNNLK